MASTEMGQELKCRTLDLESVTSLIMVCLTSKIKFASFVESLRIGPKELSFESFSMIESYIF